MRNLERYVLYTIVLFLTLVVGFLAWRMDEATRERVPVDQDFIMAIVGAVKGELNEFEGRVAGAATSSLPADVSPEAIGDAIVEAIDGQLADIDRRVADAVTGSLPAQAGVSAEAVGEVIKEAFDDQLTGVDKRVADAVYDKLKREGICELGCPETPAAVSRVLVGKNFTFLFDNAHLDPERKVKRENKGVKLDGHHVKRLELIVKAFRACQTADAPVLFHIAGYSSTAEFRVETDSGRERLLDSDDLNLATANLRMANVADYLKSRGFEVDGRPWGSIEALNRPYIDDFEPGVDQQALNRTVFLQVKNAGRCDLDQLVPPT